MTALELSRRILLSIGVVGETDTLTPEQAADTVVSINQFLSSLGSEGFATVQYANPEDDIGLEDGWEAMIQTNVAVIVAPDYGKEAAPSIQKRAMNTKRVCKRTTTLVPELNLDRERLLQRNWDDFNILNDSYDGGFFTIPPVIVLPPPPISVSLYFQIGYGPLNYVL